MNKKYSLVVCSTFKCDLNKSLIYFANHTRLDISSSVDLVCWSGSITSMYMYMYFSVSICISMYVCEYLLVYQCTCNILICLPMDPTNVLTLTSPVILFLWDMTNTHFIKEQHNMSSVLTFRRCCNQHN